MSFAKDYPISSLPGIIQNAVCEVQSCVQAPSALVATSAIASIAIACQGILDVCSPTASVTPTSLFFLSIADSGERKSSTDRFFTQPILEFEQEQYEYYRKELVDYESLLTVWEIEYKTLKSQIRNAIQQGLDEEKVALEIQLHALHKKRPSEPRLLKLTYADTTIEALLYGLYSQWPEAALLSTEASTILSARMMSQLAHLNTLWDGDAITVDRKSAQSFTLHHARLSASLMIQGQPFNQFLNRRNGHARESGFLARMLIANPPSTQGSRFKVSDVAIGDMPHLKIFHQRIKDMLGQIASKPFNSRTILDLSPEAKACWLDFYRTGENWIKPCHEGEDVRDAVSKIANNAARMAALFHYFGGKLGPIDYDSMYSACCVCCWHLMEFTRLLSPKDDVMAKYELADLLYDWLFKRHQRYGYVQCKKSDIYHFGPHCLRKGGALQAAIDQLVSDRKIFYYPYWKPAFVEINLNYGQPAPVFIPPRLQPPNALVT